MLDYENAATRCGTPNPAIRHDFHGPCQSFEPTNGTSRPPDRAHQISQQSEQVIPRTDIHLPQIGNTNNPCDEQSCHASGLLGRVTQTPLVARFDPNDARSARTHVATPSVWPGVVRLSLGGIRCCDVPRRLTFSRRLRRLGAGRVHRRRYRPPTPDAVVKQ
jgi:hypothetical protein